MSSKSTNSSKKSEDQKLAAAVASALTLLSKVQESLPLDDDLIERDRKAAVALVKFPTEALQAASEILATEGDRLASFDSSVVNDALTYDLAMTKVLRQAEGLVTSIQRSLWKRRAPGMEETLSLYAWLKRGSIRTDGSLVKYVDALAPHVILARRKATRAAKADAATNPPVIATGTPTSAPPAAAPVVTNGASAPAITQSQ